MATVYKIEVVSDYVDYNEETMRETLEDLKELKKLGIRVTEVMRL